MSLSHLIYLSESRIAGDVNAELLAINKTAHFINPADTDQGCLPASFARQAATARKKGRLNCRTPQGLTKALS